MPTLRERAADFLLGREKQQLQSMMREMYRAYLDGPYQLPPQELVRQLSEFDSAQVMDLVAQLGYDYLGSMSGYGQNADFERQRAVEESRRLFRYAPLAQWAVQTWTNFGVGESIAITCDDPDADIIWQETWRAERNENLFGDERIHELSNWTLIDGNTFIAAFASTLDGKVTFAEIPSNEIVEIVTNPENASEPLFYKRQWNVPGTTVASKTAYYPDWKAFFIGEEKLSKAKLQDGIDRADKMSISGDEGAASTAVCILHIAHNRKVRGSLWGWPLLAIAAPYARAHRDFMEDRLSVAAAKAMYVRKTKISGGSRSLAAIRGKLQSALSASNSTETNPRAVAGSTLLENQASETTDMPMTTGASDAKADHEMFAWAALIGMGLFPTTAGLDTMRWATALEMDKTQSMQWSRYQTFMSAQFKKMVQITLGYAEKYADKSFQNKEAQVSIDSLSLVDFPEVATSLGGMMSNALVPLVQNGAMEIGAAKRISQAVWRIALKALGIDDRDITSDEVFGITELPDEVNKVIQTATEKFKSGKLKANDFAELLIATFVERENGKSN